MSDNNRDHVKRIENMIIMSRMRIILSCENWPINDDIRMIENNREKVSNQESVSRRRIVGIIMR